jgi:sarcosine oxidase
VIVLGVGGMGGAACYQLARRGARVAGIEQFSAGHPFGSSHSRTRLIRRTYHEHPDYLPLIHRSYELWGELCTEARLPLLRRTGLLVAGPIERGSLLAGVLESASRHGIAIDELRGEDVSERLPGFRTPEGCQAAFEPGGGYVEVEPSLNAWCSLATAAGAALCFNERAISWSADAAGVEVVTDRDIHRADRLILTAGPWSGALLRDLGIPLAMRRIPQVWFPASGLYDADGGAPCFSFDLPYGFFYGMPAAGDGWVKVGGGSVSEAVTDPSLLDRQVRPSDLAPMRRFLEACLPGVSPEPVAGDVCMCTMTPDGRFVVDTHPRHTNVAFAVGFSGHGFRFAPAIGEILADLASTGRTRLPIEFLRLRW